MRGESLAQPARGSGTPGGEVLKVVVISHALVQEAPRARWRALAARHPVDVTLLLPSEWRSDWFGGEQRWTVDAVTEARFRVIPLPVSRSGEWYRYLFLSLDAKFRELRPDVIYVVQEEQTFILQQILLYRDLWAPSARVVFFSWNNLGVPLRSWRARLAWTRVRRGAAAAIAGNREVRGVLRAADFPAPVHVQTEIGVDAEQFSPDAVRGAGSRARLGLEGWVIGFAGRLVEEKGVLDLVACLDALEGEWTALLVGEGPLRPRIEDAAREGGWDDRLVVTGHVELDEMPDMLRAMDCLVLPSRTTAGWKEQFGLILAQAMACGVPVIGSDSGAIPEVIDEAGLIFPEGDIDAMGRALRSLRDDRALRERLAKAGMERAIRHYSATGLADATYEIFSTLAGRSA